MFENITDSSSDPIFSIDNLFNADNRPLKINLSTGIYKNEINETPILKSVKIAEKYLLKNEKTKKYLNIEGIPKFGQYIQKLIFGEDSVIIKDNRVYTIQTPGGTAALRIAADFLKKNTSVKTIWISNPSWPNHKSIFNSAGFKVKEYTYYDSSSHTLDFNGLLTSLKNVQVGDVVLFHSCCHNPTGTDLRLNQWMNLLKISIKNGWLLLFDCSYQGFAYGLEEDMKGLRAFASSHQEMIIASSCSKNFSLYNERVGACTIVAKNAKIANHIFSQLKSIVRANYSNPPAHGAFIVTIILSNSVLRKIWEQELTNMRKRIQCMRKLFVKTLIKKGANRDFSFICRQNGMFSCIGLTEKQVCRLREEFGVYVVTSGRVNISGITKNNVSLLCEAIVAVL